MADNSGYQLYLSYHPETDNLSSSLAFLSKIVNNQSKADSIIVSGLEIDAIKPKIVLEDIQYSSIKLIVTNTFCNTKEEEILDKGMVAYWNQFLLEVRKPFLEYASKNKTLKSKEDLEKLKTEAVDVAKKHNVNPVPIQGLSDEQMVDCIAAYSVPAEYLGSAQTYQAICNGKTYTLDRDFSVSSSNKDRILDGGEKIFKDQTLYLKPKKLFYEGESMWEFQNQEGNKVNGKIQDADWLNRFQNNELAASEYPFPSVILKVLADITIQLDHSQFSTGQSCIIKKVYGPVSASEVPQSELIGL